MATEAVAAPTEEVVEVEPKKKKPILLILVIALSVIILIMSVTFGTLFFSGYFERKSEAAAHEKVDELEKEAESAKAASPGGMAKVKKDAEATRFENTYLEIDKEFMTNITSSKKIMVVKVAVMTHYDSRVFDNIKKHEFAIRSAVLDVMRQSTEADVAKSDFRVEMAAKIKVVMNEMLMKYEDFGGVEDVFFTSFVMQ
jgi:flagellar FliL protein